MSEKPDDVDATSSGDEIESASTDAGEVEEAESSVEGQDEAVSLDKASSDEDAVAEDAEVEDAERELVGVGAGSARAAARRAGQVRAGVTAGKGAPTRRQTAGADHKLSLWGRLVRFFREVVSELRKVIWPARNQMVTYTVVVVVFVVFMVALVAGLDVLFATGVLKVFGG